MAEAECALCAQRTGSLIMTRDVAIQINEVGAARFIGGSRPPNVVFGVSS